MMQPDDKIPLGIAGLNPRDRENCPLIERHLLACCLRARDGQWPEDDPGIDDAAELVTPTDFALAAHGLVYDVALELRRERGVVLLADVLDRMHKRVAATPGLAPLLGDLQPKPAAWLSDTLDLEPTGAYARYYAALVREAMLFRKLRAVAGHIAREAESPPGPADEILEQCESLLFDLTDAAVVEKQSLHDAAGMMAAAGERVDERQASGGALGGMSVGYPDLDEFLGGLRPGQMVVVGARPGGGKTALGLNVAARVARNGTPVAFFSLEMPVDQIADRLLSMGAGVPMSKLTKGRPLSPDEINRVAAATGPAWVADTALFCDDSPDQSAQRVAAKLRRAVRRHGIGLAVLDYLQLFRPENPKDNRTQQVGMIARRVKQMARECKIPVVCLCQLNRSVEQRGGDRPRLSDLRESGEIEQHADIVLLLHNRPDQPSDQPVWLVDVIVAKNRNGPVGDATLAYRRPVMLFENAAA